MDSLISVIVPVYNTAGLLPRCVDSLLSQTHKDIEIILINDGSPDEAGAMCDRYAREHENIIAIHQENRGVSAARNAGLAAAHGRYLGFVDSDDWIRPEMYRALLAALTEYGTHIAACGYSVRRYDGAVFDSKVDTATPPCMERRQALESLIRPQGIQGFLCNKLFDRELLMQIGGTGPLRLDERVHICEDLLFVSRYIEAAGRVAYDSRPLYIYCVRDYGGPENYNREKRVSEFIALNQLVESWSRLSPELGAYMKQKYTRDAYHVLRAAAEAGDRGYLGILRKHLRRYLRPYLRLRTVTPAQKARILLTLALPNIENRLKAVIRGKR